MDRKIIYAGAGMIVVFIGVLVWSLTSKPPTGNGTNNGAKTNNFTIWNLDDDKIAFDEIIYKFQDENKNLKVNYVKKDTNGYLEETINQMAAGKGPDVWGVPNSWLPQLKDKLQPMPAGLLADSRYKKDDLEVYRDTFPQAVSNDNIYDNKIYGLPLAVDTLSLFYNKKIFQEVFQKYQLDHPKENLDNIRNIFYSGPKNWDEFLQAVKIITQKDGDKITRSAVALGTTTNVSDSADIVTLLMMQNGAQMTSEDLSYANFHTEYNLFGQAGYPGRRALEFYTSFANPKSPNYTWNSSMPDAIQTFANGKTAMMINYSDVSKEVKFINPNLDFDVIKVPQITLTKNPVNISSYITFVVPRTATNPKMSWNFIKLINDDSSVYISATRKDSAKSTMIGNSNNYQSQILTAKSWYNPQPIEVQKLLNSMINEVLNGGNSQTAIEGTANQVTVLLKKLKGQ